jgi:hypothetical protein
LADNDAMTPRRIFRLLIPALLVAPLTAQETTYFHESFSGELQPGWNWVMGIPAGTEIANGRLKIPGMNASIWGHRDEPIGLIVRPAEHFSEQMFTEGMGTDMVATLDTSDLEAPQGGLIWYYDNDNYVKFAKENWRHSSIVNADGSIECRLLLVAREHRGIPEVCAIVRYLPETALMRMQVVQGKIRAQYKTLKNDPWIPLVDVDPLPANPKPLRLGIYSMYHSTRKFGSYGDFRIFLGPPLVGAPPPCPVIEEISAASDKALRVSWNLDRGNDFLFQNLERCAVEFSGAHGRTAYIIAPKLPLTPASYVDEGRDLAAANFYRMVAFHDGGRVTYSPRKFYGGETKP